MTIAIGWWWVRLAFQQAQYQKDTDLVEWKSAHEEDILAYDLWRGILKIGKECTTHPENYEAITHVTAEQFIYPLDGIYNENAYQFLDKFSAIDNSIYCYGLFSIENNEFKWLDVTSRQ
ncbi:hypothetical protein THII_2660 [Thioploca ingrica]|uniref:Uncharacterized protein n=1 Tax=Thioploca ingrica TaxID=40754 RepID=A0A090AM45_9GAMM|nr:hypothetical protein THII_2660 [Thioploca ingrica]